MVNKVKGSADIIPNFPAIEAEDQSIAKPKPERRKRVRCDTFRLLYNLKRYQLTRNKALLKINPDKNQVFDITKIMKQVFVYLYF